MDDDKVTVKFLTADVKATSADGPGTFEAIISAPTLDRDGEVVAKGAFNPLPKAIPIHIDHNMSVDSWVASGTPYYAGDELRLKGEFLAAPKAQLIRDAVMAGHPLSMSVGFMDAKRVVKDGTPTITKAELLEASFVTVPSNREAIVVAAKDAAAKVGARNSKQDAARIQAAHDLMVDMGATCPMAGEPTAASLNDDADTKSTATDPEAPAAAPAAAEPPADVDVALARLAALRAEADLLLLDE